MAQVHGKTPYQLHALLVLVVVVRTPPPRLLLYLRSALPKDVIGRSNPMPDPCTRIFPPVLPLFLDPHPLPAGNTKPDSHLIPHLLPAGYGPAARKSLPLRVPS